MAYRKIGMDDIDKANEFAQKNDEAAISAVRAKAADIPVGESGECEYCGEWFQRVVGGACGRCRDEYKIE